MSLISSCSCLCPIHWSQVLCREWRCSWSSADRRCSNYIWVMNKIIAYQDATYIRGFTAIRGVPYGKPTANELTDTAIVEICFMWIYDWYCIDTVCSGMFCWLALRSHMIVCQIPIIRWLQIKICKIMQLNKHAIMLIRRRHWQSVGFMRLSYDKINHYRFSSIPKSPWLRFYRVRSSIGFNWQ